jgi:hypothetical protein
MGVQIEASQRRCLLIFASLVALTAPSSVVQVPPSADTPE